jgi:hypothetical protein
MLRKELLVTLYNGSGPKLCPPHQCNHKKPKSVKVYYNKKRKDNHHLKPFDVSEAFLHFLNDEPKDTGIQSSFTKDNMTSDWFVRQFCEWFHTKEEKVHVEAQW